VTFDPDKFIKVQHPDVRVTMSLRIRQWAQVLAAAMTTEDLAVFTAELEQAAGLDWAGE
jgi:hypothetical protein